MIKYIIKTLLIFIFTSSIFASETIEDFTIKSNNSIKFNDSDNSDSIAIQSPATLTSSVVFTFPNQDGTNGQVITTDGSGGLSWVASGAAVDTLTSTATSSSLSANMGNNLEQNKADKDYLIYGINPNPYPNPTNDEEAKAQAKAQIEKKRIDRIEQEYNAIQRNEDQIKLFQLASKKSNGETLTSAEQNELYDIQNRIVWYDNMLSEAQSYIDTIDSTSGTSSIVAIANNATFSSSFTKRVNSISIIGRNTLNNSITTITLSVSITPSDATTQTVTWSSNDTSLATVNASTGLVTALADGSVGIKAIANDGFGAYKVHTIAITGLTDTPTITANRTLIGTQSTAITNYTPTLGGDTPTSCDISPNIPGLSVNNTTCVISGTPSGTYSGGVTMSATNAGGTGNVSIAIEIAAAITPVASITINGTPTLTGNTHTFTTIITPTDATTQTVTWSSGNDSVATVGTTTGIVKSVATGTVVITATADDGSGVNDTYSVTITDGCETCTLIMDVNGNGCPFGAE